MCGISGFVDFKKISPGHILKNMSDTLLHRGPDSGGEELYENKTSQVGLAHRRLSIIDLTEQGHQPMEYNELVITFNGEIYNFNKIKKELEDQGHFFKGHSDTEVILHAYREWGIKCIEKFIGMFAFVIYDKLEQEIICARDRAGVKPLYYYWDNNLFLFASELKSFHAHPSFVKELNILAIPYFLQHGCISSSDCIFKNCFKLNPGHYLTLSLNSTKLSISKYWDVLDYYDLPKATVPFTEAKEHTEKLLVSAAEYRMVSDVPVGIFLSGGIDSSLLTALLQKNRSTPLKTFTIGVHHKQLNEAGYAKEISKHLGTDHTEYYCDEKEALDLIPLLPYYYDEPFGDQSAIATMLVSKIARRQVTVALSADGGDEIFAGYNRYDYLLEQGNKIKNIPAFIRKSLASIINNTDPDKILFLKNTHNFSLKYKKLGSLLNDPSPANYILNLDTIYFGEELQNLFAEEINFSGSTKNNIPLKPAYSPLSLMMAFDYKTYLPDDILQKVDRASMSQSLEAREPFLDHRVIEWAASLPEEFKYHNGIKKYILKEIAYQYIPKEMLNRQKMGFSVPIENWLTSELKEKVLFYLSEERLKRQGIFNPVVIHRIVREFYNGKKEFAVKTWHLLMFQMWYEKWME